MAKHLPVYGIETLDTSRREVMVKAFAPYIEEHQKLLIPHRHSFYHLVYFTEGAGTHTIDFEKFEVAPHQIYFMEPGQVHHWNFQGKVDGFVLNFSESFFQSFLLRPDYLRDFIFFQGNASDSVVDIPTHLRYKIKEIFTELMSLYNSMNPKNVDYIRVLCLALFMHVEQLMSGFETDIHPHNQLIVKKFKQLIEKKFKYLKLPKDYASLLHITPNYLNTLCTDVLGVSAGEVIRQRILLEAKRLLVNLDLTIANIAYELNFTDNSYFSKFFKKYVGMTPEEFRKNILL